MVEPWTPDLVTVARFLFGPRPLQLLENLASMGEPFCDHLTTSGSCGLGARKSV